MASVVHCPALASLGMFSCRWWTLVLVASPAATYAAPSIPSLKGLWLIPPTSQPLLELPVSNRRPLLICLPSFCLLQVSSCIVLGMQPALGRGHDLGQSSSLQHVISRRELAAEDCLLVTLSAAGGTDPSFLKGNLGGFSWAWVYLCANIMRVLAFLTPRGCENNEIWN